MKLSAGGCRAGISDLQLDRRISWKAKPKKVKVLYLKLNAAQPVPE